jgi:hypothetical protein
MQSLSCVLSLRVTLPWNLMPGIDADTARDRGIGVPRCKGDGADGQLPLVESLSRQVLGCFRNLLLIGGRRNSDQEPHCGFVTVERIFVEGAI